jgi:hypothetical protein
MNSDEWEPPTAELVIRDALKHLHAGLSKLERHEQTPRPLRFLAMHNLAIAEQILNEYLSELGPP